MEIKCVIVIFLCYLRSVIDIHIKLPQCNVRQKYPHMDNNEKTVNTMSQYYEKLLMPSVVTQMFILVYFLHATEMLHSLCFPLVTLCSISRRTSRLNDHA